MIPAGYTFMQHLRIMLQISQCVFCGFFFGGVSENFEKMLLHSSPPNFLTKLIFLYDFIMRKKSGEVMSATTTIYFALKFGYMENIEGYIGVAQNFQLNGEGFMAQKRGRGDPIPPLPPPLATALDK